MSGINEPDCLLPAAMSTVLKSFEEFEVAAHIHCFTSAKYYYHIISELSCELTQSYSNSISL